jgi:hypothetical protein
MLATHLAKRDLLSVETARQGIAIDLVYETQFLASGRADELVKALNRIEGVQGVTLTRRPTETP